MGSLIIATHRYTDHRKTTNKDDKISDQIHSWTNGLGQTKDCPNKQKELITLLKVGEGKRREDNSTSSILSLVDKADSMLFASIL